MRPKALLKPRRPAALSADAEEVVASVEVIVAVVADVVREDVAEAEGGLLEHLLVLFVSSLALRPSTNSWAF